MIHLLPLPWADRARVAHLRRLPAQEEFVEDPAALVPDPSLDLYAVVQDDAVVGMFKLHHGYHLQPHHEFAGPGDLGLRSVLVDAGHQGRGIGGRMLAALPALVADRYPGVRRLVLTVNLRNAQAKGAYLRAGWHDGGDLYLHGGAGPQHVLVLVLPPATRHA